MLVTTLLREKYVREIRLSVTRAGDRTGTAMSRRRHECATFHSTPVYMASREGVMIDATSYVVGDSAAALRYLLV